MKKNITIKIRLFIILLAAILTLNCSNKREDVKYSKGITETLSSWNLFPEVSEKFYNDTLYVNIEYLQVSDWDTLDFFYDKATNFMIIELLVYLNQDIVQDNKAVKFIVEFEGYPDVASFIFNDARLMAIKQRLDNSEFAENLIYSLENFRYLDIVFLDNTIKGLAELLLPNYDKEYYWDTLEGISNFCENGRNKQDALMFIFLYDYLHLKLNKDAPENCDKKLFHILKKCGFRTDFSGKNKIQIDSILDYKELSFAPY